LVALAIGTRLELRVERAIKASGLTGLDLVPDVVPVL